MSPSPRFRTGWRRGKKKAEDYISADYLTEALSTFSGYIAADELYDGPFCVLSIVDNRAFKRLVYEVLDHDPKHEDIVRFFGRFQRALESRGLHLQGITTDASALYPAAIAAVFGNVPHQVCEFHTIADLTKAILKAVSAVRRALKAKMPRLARGRPRTNADRSLARRKKRLQRRVTELFDHRHLLVRRHCTAAQKRRLEQITRGLPHLRTLREIMTEVYRLFDNRCHTDTALQKLAVLRRRVRRFKGVGKTLQTLFSPSLQKALTFLSNAPLPATSNAVERGNRRHRKMQKSVYRVRSRANIRGRIALDMQRDAQAVARTLTIDALHSARAGFTQELTLY